MNQARMSVPGGEGAHLCSGLRLAAAELAGVGVCASKDLVGPATNAPMPRWQSDETHCAAPALLASRPGCCDGLGARALT